jgi:hypothetical protein
MWGLENAYRDRLAQLVEEMEEKLEDLRKQVEASETAHKSEPS